MITANNLNQSTFHKDLSENFDLIKGVVTFDDYKIIFLVMLFLRFIKTIQIENNLDYKIINEKELDITLDGKIIILPEKSDFEYLLSKSHLSNNINRFEEAINLFISKNCILFNDNYYGLSINKSKFSDIKQSDLLFEKLFNIVENINNEYKKDKISIQAGKIFETYINYFSLVDSKNSGQSYTQSSLNDLLAKLISPEKSQTIYDPACGTGSLLLRFNDCLLYGQEINATTHAIAILNMILHGNLSYKLELGNTLLNPKFINQYGELMQFDIAISNPPLALSNWGYEELIKDKFKRFTLGMPPKSRGDFAFILHMINSINDNGRMAIIVPNGVLFRSGTEAEIRKKLIENNLIDTVIGLPEKLFFGTAIPIIVLILKKNKTHNNIKFIDASKKFIFDKNLNSLSKENIDEIVTAYKQDNIIDDFVYTTNINEIRENEYNLNISRYIKHKEINIKVDLYAIQEEHNNLKKELHTLENQMQSYLNEWRLKDK
ncbi:N-6 DNA methylase [Acinetobacter baumannii]|uniref:N-6 DNA methylase n=1 Tax=Acinetobacter baumannii TaxID=470 RepID=UPI001D2A2C40|nr:N-6 DNA methylase [Acinetobacter baumannii]EJC1499915.1 N-6 DNA methylase [Acinetobacter baumannii]EJG9676538.1 N-6 DNA methylase [Acinetobacter baumannii]EKV0794463.1 N-6 DNA methylase [Acinetobacter baumannii]EKV2352047.1 N-6 DNA methylase [Acinetobacter baumannii]WBS82931.1 N-6 DNA methylase [Acinetobacter baumannii]